MSALKGLGGNKPEAETTNDAEEENRTDTQKESFAKSQPAADENEPVGKSELEDAENIAEDMSRTEGQVTGGDLAAAEQAENAPEGSTTYSSHPIERFRIGGYQFEKGSLTLEGDDVQKFEKLLESAPPREQATVKKIDVDSVNKLAKSFLSSNRTRGVDTSADRPGQ